MTVRMGARRKAACIAAFAYSLFFFARAYAAAPPPKDALKDAAGATAPVAELAPVEILGVTPLHGIGLAVDRIPAPVQTATSEDLAASGQLDLSGFLNQRLGSVSVNSSLGNPLQPDLQYRGFTASPTLGQPQGIAVFQNGVRIQEPFGDTMNWDLLPRSSIASINLMPGANPLFGLNSLGGALSIETKDGFRNPDHTLEAEGGSFGRVVQRASSGAARDHFGYFSSFEYFDEDGFRQNSPSQVKNFYFTSGWHDGPTTVDAYFNYGNSELYGNGPLPVELLAQQRNTYFTAPDITRNEMKMVTLTGSHAVNSQVRIEGNLFQRRTQIQTVNGDTTAYRACAAGANGTGTLLVRPAPGGGDDGDAACGPLDYLPSALVRNSAGLPISGTWNALNNHTGRNQVLYGGTGQTTFSQNLLGRENQFILGASYQQGLTDFRSQVEVALLLANRQVQGEGETVPLDAVGLKTGARTWSLFGTDTYSLTPDLHLTLAGRFNSNRVVLADQTGQTPALNGRHDFDRFNPSAGLAWSAHPLVGVYGNYSESARAPTPVELACADPAAPCRLPNAFLADPPLRQVVAKGFDAGLRGDFDRLGSLPVGRVHWRAGIFTTTNHHDILFQSTGGATGNQGFFANVGDTRRQGVELGLDGAVATVHWFLNYTYLEAIFLTPFQVHSPNHPLADPLGNVAVRTGDRIPGLPEHMLKVGADWAVVPTWKVGANVQIEGDRFLRGDEANLLKPTGGLATLNLTTSVQVSRMVSIYGMINNVLDQDYETFGLLGRPGEALGPGYTNPRFQVPAAGRAGFGGIRITL